MSFKFQIRRHLINLKGTKTPRKLIAIESDDWGAIRMPSKEVFEALKKQQIPVAQCHYCQNDSLASEDDLAALFETLQGFQDIHGSHPKITANTVVANPDFDKIRECGFSEYHYEPFTETLKRYPNHSNAFGLWKEGMENGLFIPQFHGREHVNIELWLQELQHPDSVFRTLFDHRMWGLGGQQAVKDGINIQASFDTNHYETINTHKQILKDGLDLFASIFGYRSRSFIANNFIYHSDLNATLKKAGVNLIQGMKYQKHPRLGQKKRKMIRHYTGEENAHNQQYLVRNCVFEPSQMPPGHDSVDSCLKDIANAFFWNRPAIITAHRLNFIGQLNPANRDNNLKLLKKLLTEIQKKWPDVEFLASHELGELIEAKINSKGKQGLVD